MKKTPRVFKQWLTDAAAILGGLALTLPLLWVLVQGQRISWDRGVATGTVLRKEIVVSKDESPDVYDLRYSFRDASGSEYSGRGSVDVSFYRKTVPGATLLVEYATADPRTSRIAGAFDPMFIEMLGLAVSGIGLFVYLGPRRWARTSRGEPDPVLN